MIGGELVSSIINAGGKLGIKSKNEDTIGRILKGLSSIPIIDKNTVTFLTVFLENS